MDQGVDTLFSGTFFLFCHPCLRRSCSFLVPVLTRNPIAVLNIFFIILMGHGRRPFLSTEDLFTSKPFVRPWPITAICSVAL